MPSYFPAIRYGGPIVSVHGLCRALAKRGHDVHIFTTNVDGDKDSDVPLGIPVDIEGVQVWYFPVPAFRRLYWAPRMRAALSLRMPLIDVVHTHSVFLWPTWTAARVAQENNVPYLLAPRGMLVKNLIRRKSTLIKRAWIALIETRNVENAAGIHVTSAAEAADLASFRMTLPRVYEVPNGYDPVTETSSIGSTLPPAIDAALGSGRQSLLYLGRINWKKGIDRLIRALAQVPDAMLLVVGNDEEGYTPKLIALAEAERVRDRVLFPGPVYGAAKAEIYRRAALLVMPSYSENFGNVVLEAMAAGCPVVVTPEVGASTIVAESGGGLVVAGDPSLLADSVRVLLGDVALRREMGQRARDHILNQYSWDSVAGRMLEVYQEAMDGRTAKWSQRKMA